MTMIATNTEVPRAGCFGERMRFAREKRGQTTVEVSRLLGVSERTFRRWESGKAAPRSNRIPIIAGTLNVPMRWLMSGDGELDEQQGDITSLQDRNDLELIEEVRSIKEFMIGAANRLADYEEQLRSLAANSAFNDVDAEN